ncbi:MULTISPECIES: hypothetical protein [Cupriavidus]|uniref:hypothetical protein n=1 Tax=Cupriavidus TaxID=106589 RepID=UPI0012FF7E63|nr:MULTISPECIES: hypothetical protein [Cupriavidus]
MTTIQEVRGYEILDSRGHPTVAAQVRLADGTLGETLDAIGVALRAAAPAA